MQMIELNYKNFLYSLWGLYSSSQKLYYEIFILKNGKPRVLFFSDVDSAIAWLDDNLQKFNDADVYCGVLPRSRIKEKGKRGSEEDVERGLYLWVDLDYKKEMTKDEFERFLKKANRTDIDINKDIWYEEHKDHIVIGFYKKEDKYVVFTRPSLSYVLEKVKKTIGIEPSIVVDSGNGYHLYFKLKYDIDAKRLKKLEKALVEALGGDQNATDLARVLRLPGSTNQRTGRKCNIILYNINEYDPAELEKVLNVEEQSKEAEINDDKKEEKGHEVKHERELTNNQILEIVKILEPVYRVGARHEIILYLTGWLYKARISYKSAETLIKAICDTYKDEECEDRFYTLRDTYGINKTPREMRLKDQGKGLKTKTGLFDWIVNKARVADEETALGIIKKLEEILETPEPNLSVIIEKMNYEKEIYAIVNFRKCEVLTAMRRKDGDGNDRLIYKDRVILGCPELITAIMTPFSQIIKYDLVWNIPIQKRKLTLENVTVDEILAYLKANGLVLKKYQAEDVLNAVLNAMLRKGLAEVKTGFDSPGFYWDKGKLIANKVEVKEPNAQELKEALGLLNELVNVWFANIKEQFVTVLKIGLLMPFSFAIKQKFKGEKGFLPWLYLYGQRDTGKTTTAEVLLYIFNIMNRQHELGVGEVNTEAKLGAVLSSDTFPHVINEGASLFDKPNLNEVIKQAVEGLIARQRFESKSIIKEYPAFAPLIITANEFKITDEALSQKRLVVLRYPITAKVTKEKIAEFREKVTNRLPKLKALGQFIEWYLIEHPDELIYDWLNLSKKLLERAYEYAGLTPGFDLGMQYIDVNDNDSRVDIIAVLWRKVLEAFNKKIEVVYENGDYTRVTNPLAVLDSVLESHAVDFMIKKNDEVMFTSKVLQILKDEGVNIDSMTALAELFADYKFEYERKKVMGKTTRVLVVKYEDLMKLFYDFFQAEEEGKDANNEAVIRLN